MQFFGPPKKVAGSSSSSVCRPVGVVEWDLTRISQTIKTPNRENRFAEFAAMTKTKAKREKRDIIGKTQHNIT